MTDEWGDLILWHGGECPVPKDERVQVIGSNLKNDTDVAAHFNWREGMPMPIIAYRRRKQPETRTWRQGPSGEVWSGMDGPVARTLTAQVDRDGLFFVDTYVGEKTGAKIEVKL